MPKKGSKETKGQPRYTAIGRDAKTGQFLPVKEALRRPSTTTVERVPKPGYGDTKKK